MDKDLALELKGITKTFGKVYANKNVDLQLHHGEILAVLGENGSGKTTLMNMVSGIYYPDEGQIFVNGEEVVIKSPRDAFNYKIGMIHQHFKLVDVFNATENIVLGNEDNEKFNLKKFQRKVKEITEKYGFVIDLNKKIYEMPVSEKQTVEILKVLYRGADILILDEPTAVLTPQEITKLFDILRRMKQDGKSIIIITHKLHEVLEISDRVTTLRKGENVGTIETKDANEQILTEMMVGEKIDLNIERAEVKNKHKRLRVENLNVKSRDGKKLLDNVSFEAYSGEILGIAGISGCGQKELLESIAGLQKTVAGSSIIFHDGNEEKQLVGKSPREIRKLGVALSFVPEDRLGMGLVGNMDIIDNMMLRSYKKGHSAFLERTEPKQVAEEIIDKLDVVTPSATTPVRRLSGGNVQKVLVGREISQHPKLLMVAYPVRGLDINSSYTIYNLLTEQKEIGTAVIFVGEDLDVLIELCDRIMVINSGRITGIVDAKSAVKEDLGLLMTMTSSREEENEE